MLLTVTGFESSKTVQVRIYNITTSIEVVAWTATGVSERADGQGYSTYYYDYAIVSGDKYIVDWKDNSSPIRTASEGINEKQSGVALDSTVAKEATLNTAQSGITRIQGLVLDNAVEDDIVRDGNGNKTSSILYHYNSAANATTHDKVTGLIGKYNVIAVYSGNNMTLFKTPRIT